MTEKILVIDDEPDLLSVISFILESTFSVKVETAPSKETALEMLKGPNPSFRGIICDFQLKDGSGKDILNFLTGKSLQIPLVYCSGAPIENTPDFSSPLIKGCLLKPFSKDEILETVAKAFGLPLKG